jgi:hypothetical protein
MLIFSTVAIQILSSDGSKYSYHCEPFVRSAFNYLTRLHTSWSDPLPVETIGLVPGDVEIAWAKNDIPTGNQANDRVIKEARFAKIRAPAKKGVWGESRFSF